MKKCGSCRKTLPLDRFHRRGAGYQTWCKQCRRVYDRDYHRRHGSLRVRQARLRHEALVGWYRELKTDRPCADCRGRFHHAAMTWDHLPGVRKVAEVSTLAYHTHSRASVLAEIAKCELVCANCHAVRSFERARGVAQPG
jgi:hypothetical protein